MVEYHTPHDKFFKEIFSQLDIAEDFFRNYLPSFIASKIKPNSIEKLDDSFVDENLKSHFADLLFRVELTNSTNAYLYLLFEHKSSPDKFVAFQILRYLTRIWEKSLTEKEKKLPIVLPIVFYHGNRKWKVANDFSNLFDIPNDLQNLRQFLPDFQYYLVDVNKFDDENFAGEAALQSILQLFKHIFDNDLQAKLTAIFRKLIAETDREKAFQILLVVINYILQSGRLSEKELGDAVNETEDDLGEQAMITVLDRKFAEGKERGIQIGKKEGVEIGLELARKEKHQEFLETAKEIITLKFGKPPKKITEKINILNSSQLQMLIVESIKFETLEAVEKWLERK